jgi:hypothetical protein
MASQEDIDIMSLNGNTGSNELLIGGSASPSSTSSMHSSSKQSYGAISQTDTAIDNAMQTAMYIREHRHAGFSTWMGYRCIVSVAVSYAAIVLHSLIIDEALRTSTGFGFECGSVG